MEGYRESELQAINCKRSIHNDLSLPLVRESRIYPICCMLYLDVMLLQIETRRIAPDVTVLELAGKIALGRESQKIETLVQDLLRQNEKKIIFDISRVDHIDSTGIGVMAYCFGTLNRCGGELRLAGACGKVLHLLQITHLDKVLPLCASVEDACQSLGIKSQR